MQTLRWAHGLDHRRRVDAGPGHERVFAKDRVRHRDFPGDRDAHRTDQLPESPQVAGMLRLVAHLVKVEAA